MRLKVYKLNPTEVTAICTYLLSWRGCSFSSEDHLIYNFILIGPFVCSDRLSIVGDLKHSESTIEPDI
jgi:hypothetical protein